MSKALRCDRCGAFYEEYPVTITVSNYKRNKQGEIRSAKTMDLCMTCEKKLKYFIERVQQDSCKNED